MAKKKSSKHKESCKAYRSRNQRVKNKIQKLRKHIDRQPSDNQAFKALQKIGG